MGFIYKNGIAVDEELGAELRSNYGFRDGEYTFRYIFKLKGLALNLEVIFNNTPYQSLAPNGEEETYFVTSQVFILEDTLLNSWKNQNALCWTPSPVVNGIKRLRNH